MSKRGRPRKRQRLFTVKNYIEYTSDSDSDLDNIRHNVTYEIKKGSLQSIGRHAELGHNSAAVRAISVGPPDRSQEIDSASTIRENVNRAISAQPPDRSQQLRDDQDLNDVGEYISTDIEIDEPTHLEAEPNDDREVGEYISTDIEIELEAEQENDHQQGQHTIEDEEVEQPSDYSGDEQMHDEEENQTDIFENLKSQWLLSEIQHSVSKSASEAFWRLSMEHIPKLENFRKRKKNQQFKSIRRKMYDDLLPSVDMEIAYRNTATGEIRIVKDSITPRKEFPANEYEKLYEIGTLKVS